MKKKLYIIKTFDNVWYIGRTKNLVKKFCKILDKESQRAIELMYFGGISKEHYSNLLNELEEFKIGKDLYGHRVFGSEYSVEDVLRDFGLIKH